MRKKSLVLASGLVLACSSSSSGTTVSADQACADEASALCGKVSACYATFFQYEFSDMTTCTNAAHETCSGALSANGTSRTPSGVEACAQAINALSCADALSALKDNAAVAACQPAAGTLADGAACGDDGQCTHQYCKIGKNSTCGACSSKSSAGTACNVTNDCQSGLVCGGASDTTGGTCVTPSAPGATCDPTHPCAGEYQCTLTKAGGTSGTCTAALSPGTTCDVATQGFFCDAVALTVCLPVQNTCVEASVVAAGNACGLTASTSVAVCAGDGLYGPLRGCSASSSGTCQAQVANGGSCIAGAAASCIYPAICESGVCTLPNASSCH